MEPGEAPPPFMAPAENDVKYDTNNNEEEEGEQFDFESGDEAPEADRQALACEGGGTAPGLSSSSLEGGDKECGTGALAGVEPAELTVPVKVNPYSIIDITPLQEDALPPPEPPTEEDGVAGPVPSGYLVPAPCGYAVPSSLPALLPAYSSPVIIRMESVDEEAEAPEVAEDHQLNSPSAADPPHSGDQSSREGNALARWAADPANTAWMDNPEEAIYDDVPRENSDSEPDEMVYDDVENGEQGGNSSVEYGWSSSEFESYEEQSDSECRNGVPRSFLRGSHKKQLSHDLTRLKAHCEEKMRGLVASAVGAVEVQQLRRRQERKMQKLMKAAKEGTKDGLERTKAAVKRGRSFIRTKSFIPQDHRSGLEEEQSLFVDVDCRHTEAVLTPMPEGLSPQQVVRRCILGSIVESEKNYVDALRRILEQYEKPLSELEPRVLSERKLKAVFYRVKEIAQCHSLFQMALASRVAEWDTVETIGDVFVASFSKSMVLDAYSEYVNNFSTAVAVLKKTCATKPAFLEFLKQSREAGPDRVTLHSLMMRPIQRFPQFILLLQDMLKNTSRGHPDRLPLQMALTELETLAEKLNERKRDADRRCEIRHIAKAVNERYLNKLLSSGSRYLLRSDDMIETVYNDRGEVAKTKGRRLFLLNDVLVCATVSSRPSQESHSGAGQRYLLKWSVPLGHVEVIEYGSGPSVGEHSRHPTAHAPESLAVSANVKPHKAYLGPGQLYQDLQNLLHDLNVVGQIAQLIGSLRGNYQNLNQSVAHDWTSGLQRLILKKEDEIRAADRCRIQLQLPGKQDKSGRPTFFTAVFNTFTPAIKEAWTSHLQMAKLALEEDNHLGWFCVDDDGNQTKKDTHPLLVGHMPVMVARQPEFKDKYSQDIRVLTSGKWNVAQFCPSKEKPSKFIMLTTEGHFHSAGWRPVNVFEVPVISASAVAHISLLVTELWTDTDDIHSRDRVCSLQPRALPQQRRAPGCAFLGGARLPVDRELQQPDGSDRHRLLPKFQPQSHRVLQRGVAHPVHGAHSRPGAALGALRGLGCHGHPCSRCAHHLPGHRGGKQPRLKESEAAALLRPREVRRPEPGMLAARPARRPGQRLSGQLHQGHRWILE
ncbi:rho guanine nucleotide exchange factor 10 isoform X12 [Octodon degus]|uniref:Rho guanine nucleotide exchange factor 10 isoform X12 n=1 Tax=Octodon degus TaxID=10160 RepID=A0A6P6DEI5_OCTDE|nr:rho guanine nucleotide exchange factor 10 isoform X12 [Octodon degus]